MKVLQFQNSSCYSRKTNNSSSSPRGISSNKLFCDHSLQLSFPSYFPHRFSPVSLNCCSTNHLYFLFHASPLHHYNMQSPTSTDLLRLMHIFVLSSNFTSFNIKMDLSLLFLLLLVLYICAHALSLPVCVRFDYILIVFTFITQVCGLFVFYILWDFLFFSFFFID